MSSAVWYFSRATGLVSLVLFTGVVVLGALGAGRFATPAWPRFTVAALHRNLALTSLAFLVAHIASAILDGYVSLSWLDVVIPFGSDYQPLWVGLGAVAIDLLLAPSSQACCAHTSRARPGAPCTGWRTSAGRSRWCTASAWPRTTPHTAGSSPSTCSACWPCSAPSPSGPPGRNADTATRKLSPLGGTR